MFIFSLNRFVVVGEFVYNLVKQYSAIFDIKQNNVGAKGNVAFFFGVNKASICTTGICAKFPFKQTFIYLFIDTFSLFINKFQTKVCAIPSQLETVLGRPFQK